MPQLQLLTHSPAETEMVGRRIGALLHPGDFLALKGDLGGGKTCLTRGVVAVVAPANAHLVASPTYAIMNIYADKVPVYHFDFYRLSGDDDIAELGFEEYFSGDGVCVAEWSERLTALMPVHALILLFEYVSAEVRRITISGEGDAERLIEILSQEQISKKL